VIDTDPAINQNSTNNSNSTVIPTTPTNSTIYLMDDFRTKVYEANPPFNWQFSFDALWYNILSTKLGLMTAYASYLVREVNFYNDPFLAIQAYNIFTIVIRNWLGYLGVIIVLI